jgi:signal transduction histidine kinase
VSAGAASPDSSSGTPSPDPLSDTRAQGRHPAALASRTRTAMVAVAAMSVLVVFAVFYAAWTVYTITVRRTELAKQVEVIATGISASPGLPGGPGDPDRLRERLVKVEAGLIGARLAMTDASGRVLFATSTVGRGTFPVARMAPRADSPVTTVENVAGAGRLLLVAAKLPETTGASYLVASQPLAEINQARLPAVYLFMFSVLVALVAAWFAGSWLARRIAGPIVRLRGAAEAVTGGDWGHQVPVEGEEEVAALAESFNAMSTRVADAYAAQKDFVGDVSHELRTPITSIQGFAGALTDGTITGEAERARYLGVIRDEAARLADLTSTLLALADMDAGTARFANGPVSASALAESLRSRYTPVAAEARVTMEIADLAGTPSGDEARVLQAITVLVDNALAYTPAGGALRVTTAAAPRGRWRLHVDDSGPGIPPEKREEVFRRFVRLDPSRSKRAGGSGLGLAICRRMVELMGGRVWAEASDLGGARFVVELPAWDSRA